MSAVFNSLSMRNRLSLKRTGPFLNVTAELMFTEDMSFFYVMMQLTLVKILLATLKIGPQILSVRMIDIIGPIIAMSLHDRRAS